MRRYFLTGLFILLPLAITIYILVTGFKIIDGFLGDLIELIFDRTIHGAGASLTFLLILGTGLFATNILGRKIISLAEYIFLKIPIASKVYQGVKQLIHAFSNSANKDAFKKVVMVEHPRKGVYSIAFLTASAQGEIQHKLDKPSLSIFIPTTPNPTSGFFLVVPAEECIPLEMTVEEAFKLIISAGVLVPDFDPNQKK